MKIVAIVHPHSKLTQVKKDENGVFRVYVTQSAVQDKANLAVLKALANYLHVNSSQLILDKGRTSKKKIIIVLE
ncbi:MAG TPA: DUF167 family protein [Candidatus Woesebacteria bacterium]|nr:DUF167 family protein [Candidatus Woesebacteria bacterium]